MAGNLKQRRMQLEPKYFFCDFCLTRNGKSVELGQILIELSLGWGK